MQKQIINSDEIAELPRGLYLEFLQQMRFRGERRLLSSSRI